MTPTQRTLARLREDGYLAAVVERYVRAPHLPGGGYRLDLFGCIDVIAVKPDETLAVQCFTTAWSEHKAKLAEEEVAAALAMWLSAGNRFQLWGWSLKSQRNDDNSYATYKNGKRKPKAWTLTAEEILLADVGELI